MRSEIRWIEGVTTGRLAIMPRPRSGEWLENEITGWKTESVDIVVSMLEAPEIKELGLQQEPVLCEKNGIKYISFPIPDRGIPEKYRVVYSLAQQLAVQIQNNKSVIIHCRAGIGRSALMAACVLLCLGFNSTEAFETISTARGVTVPDTDEQRAWVENFQIQLQEKT